MIAAGHHPVPAGVAADARPGVVIDVDYAVLAPVPSAPALDDRLFAVPASPRRVEQAVAAKVTRPSSIGLAGEPRLGAFSQAADIGFWSFGFLAAALAFWVAGGHALFLG